MSLATVIDTLIEPTRRVTVTAGQRLLYLMPVLGGSTAAIKREIILTGEGAEVDVIGLFLGGDHDQLNLTVDTTHAAPNTRGRTEFKAVLGGQSSLEFNGMIKILPGAQGSHDFLQQDSLLLSDGAKANAVPGLEIEANDVKASHGATAKPVDLEQKFYLMSRGLSAPQAEAMVVLGFLAPVMKRFIAAEWQKKIQSRLQTNFNLAHVLA